MRTSLLFACSPDLRHGSKRACASARATAASSVARCAASADRLAALRDALEEYRAPPTAAAAAHGILVLLTYTNNHGHALVGRVVCYPVAVLVVKPK